MTATATQPQTQQGLAPATPPPPSGADRPLPPPRELAAKALEPVGLPRIVRGLPFNEYRRLWRAGLFETTSRANPKRRCPHCGKPSGRRKSRRGYACLACTRVIENTSQPARRSLRLKTVTAGGRS